ncbi:hypothetical protein MSG28_005411 [Choristoneura fumiferana]|uniref:Uncharacterized protein n=1 Tax=Choristoneura fumiferana TaxID=7141 RepID=A0ACC0JR44_CHOFU|nr:hypothetical protein MSG28_005411 [Choristoneura fumiferana]
MAALARTSRGLRLCVCGEGGGGGPTCSKPWWGARGRGGARRRCARRRGRRGRPTCPGWPRPAR